MKKKVRPLRGQKDKRHEDEFICPRCRATHFGGLDDLVSMDEDQMHPPHGSSQLCPECSRRRAHDDGDDQAFSRRGGFRESIPDDDCDEVEQEDALEWGMDEWDEYVSQE